jgi:hypothetical protein
VGEAPDGNGDAVRRRWGGEYTASEVVIEAVAAATGRDPMELPPLYRTVDPEAVDALFGGADGDPERDVFLSFTYAGAAVTVDDGGELTARPRGENR